MSNIVEIDLDTDRVDVESFFAANISDPQRERLLPRRYDPHAKFRSHILAIREGDEIVAALHAAPPVYEEAEMRRKGVPPESGSAALRDYVMLYSLAVSENHRRQGLATLLMDHLESRTAKDSTKAIYGVCAADSAEFYRARGYEVRPPKKSLTMRWGASTAVFPINGDAQWFMKRLPTKSASTSAFIRTGPPTIK